MRMTSFFLPYLLYQGKIKSLIRKKKSVHPKERACVFKRSFSNTAITDFPADVAAFVAKSLNSSVTLPVYDTCIRIQVTVMRDSAISVAAW